MAALIEIKDLRLELGSKQIFDNLNLNIEDSSFTTLMGATGSGKTILAKTFLGLYPYYGSIKIDKKQLNQNYQNIKVVFENNEFQFVGNTVKEELMISLENLNYSLVDMKNSIDRLSRKSGITHLLERNPTNLSCGEKQIITVLSAILSNPKILILDNALCMIDKYQKDIIVKVLKSYQKKGMTIIHMTQNAEDLLYGNYFVILNSDKIVLNQKIDAIYDFEKEFRSAKVSMPFVATLSSKLKYYQLVQKVELDQIRLVNAIWK